MKKASLLMLAFLLYILPVNVSAHATMESSNPEEGAVTDGALADIELNFNESIESIVTAELTQDGEPVETGEAMTHDTMVMIMLEDDLADGEYSLNWAVISADGHEVSDTLNFSVEGSSVTEDSASEETETNTEEETATESEAAAESEEHEEESGSDTGLIASVLGVIAVAIAIVLFFYFRKKD